MQKMPMASISPDFHALNFENYSKMVNWILVVMKNYNFLVFGIWFLGFSKRKKNYIPMKISLAFIWMVSSESFVLTLMLTTVHARYKR